MKQLHGCRRNGRELPIGERSSLGGYGVTKDKILMSVMRDVTSTVFAYDWDGAKWISKPLDFPANGSVGVASSSERLSMF